MTRLVTRKLEGFGLSWYDTALLFEKRETSPQGGVSLVSLKNNHKPGSLKRSQPYTVVVFVFVSMRSMFHFPPLTDLTAIFAKGLCQCFAQRVKHKPHRTRQGHIK